MFGELTKINKNYRVTMTTTLNTSYSENTMQVLSARRGVSACMYFLVTTNVRNIHILLHPFISSTRITVSTIEISCFLNTNLFV